MKIVVTGGRNFTDGERIAADVRALRGMMKLERLAHGDARGADRLAALAGVAAGVDVEAYPVDRKRDGKWPAAGPRRNARMLEAERPELVLAYPDPLSRGTWQCVKAALSRGISVIVWAPELSLSTIESRFVELPPGIVDGSRFLMWPTLSPGGEPHSRRALAALGGAA